MRKSSCYRVLVLLILTPQLGGCMGTGIGVRLSGNPALVKIADKVTAPLTRKCLFPSAAAEAEARADFVTELYPDARRKSHAEVEKKLVCYPARIQF